MQLTKEQRVFVVTTWISTRNIKRVQALFAQHFLGQRSPCNDTIWKNFNKCQQKGTSHNLKKGRSARESDLKKMLKMCEMASINFTSVSLKKWFASNKVIVQSYCCL
ncbi:Protein of unknown function DUF4817 [Trinorchestia longiramus]|nr:Protein of unknown function DUF4817 [Trinorchestia longiramus]